MINRIRGISRPDMVSRPGLLATVATMQVEQLLEKQHDKSEEFVVFVTSVGLAVAGGDMPGAVHCEQRPVSG